MKIRVLRNLGAGLPNYRENEVVDVTETEGESLAKRGLCEILESKAKKSTADKSEPKSPAAKDPKAKKSTAENPSGQTPAGE